MAVNHVNVHQAKIPEPLHAQYPDGGVDVVTYAPDDPGFLTTAHAGGYFRVWRAERRIGEWTYHPIKAVGMTDEEIRRAVALACQMLSLPHNRAGRRARAAVH